MSLELGYVVLVGFIGLLVWSFKVNELELKYKDVVSKIIRESAERMSLRDKGEVEANSDNECEVHTFCETRLRIGITEQCVAVQYCWRCEVIIQDDESPDPDGKEPLPVEEASRDSVVIVLRPKKVA